MPPSLSCHNLPVYTKSGQHLGRVVDVEVEARGSQVVYYHIAPTVPLVGKLWHKKLLVSPRQIVSLSADKMVVEDNVSAEVEAPAGLVTEPTA